MKTLTKLLPLIAVCTFLAGIANEAWADEWIWFTSPTNGSIIYLEPGQSGVGVYVNINFVTHPYPYFDWKTKIKVDNGGWQENLLSFTTDPLGPGPHYFAVELWENY